MNNEQKNELQRLARHYLARLKGVATKHGLSDWVSNIIQANKRGDCSATEKEVELLARMCDDDRVNRTDIPNILGISYRTCFDNDIFDKIKKLGRKCVYSKVSAILFSKRKKYV